MQMSAGQGPTLADLAAEAGYSGQAHMTRAFRAVAIVTPMQYTNAAPPERHQLLV